MIREHDTVILAVDLPEHGLRRGDLGAVVHVYGAGEEFEVEFVALDGETIALVTLGPDSIRTAERDEIPHVRAVVRPV